MTLVGWFVCSLDWKVVWLWGLGGPVSLVLSGTHGYGRLVIGWRISRKRCQIQSGPRKDAPCVSTTSHVSYLHGWGAEGKVARALPTVANVTGCFKGRVNTVHFHCFRQTAWEESWCGSSEFRLWLLSQPLRAMDGYAGCCRTVHCLHSWKRQEWAPGSEDVAVLCQLALDVRSLTHIYGSSRCFSFQIHFKELLSHFLLFLGSPALSCTLTYSYLLASFSSLSISWQWTHIFTPMLMHILDFAATYVDILPLETGSTCLGQWGSMGENTKLPSKHPRPPTEWWETCQLPRSALSAPQPCPPGTWGDDGLRPYRGSQRPASSCSPCHPISTLALSLGFTILWGIAIACLAHRRNYSCNYLRHCFTVRGFYQTLWGCPRASVCFTESKSLPSFSS